MTYKLITMPKIIEDAATEVSLTSYQEEREWLPLPIRHVREGSKQSSSSCGHHTQHTLREPPLRKKFRLLNKSERIPSYRNALKTFLSKSC